MPQQPISNLRALSVLHFSLFIGQLMFAGIAAYLIYSKSIKPTLSNEEVVIMVGAGVIGLAVALVIAAFAGFKKKVEKTRLNADAITEKLKAYRASSIIRWAMLELPTLLAIIVFMLTANQMLLIVVVSLLLLFYYTKPTSFKVAQDLGINEEEVQ